MIVEQTSFADYIKGKRVVFVGPASSIIGTKQKELIEKYDVIIRTHAPVPERLIPDMGNRTDVIYSKGYGKTANIQLGHFDINVREYLKKNVKWLIYANMKDTIAEKFRREVHGICNFDKADYNFISAIGREIKGCPTTGFGALLHLTTLNFSELYITGITFGKGGYGYCKEFGGIINQDAAGVREYGDDFNGFFKGLVDQAREKKIRESNKYMATHNLEGEFQYFIKICKENPKIKVDHVLNRLMQT